MSGSSYQQGNQALFRLDPGDNLVNFDYIQVDNKIYIDFNMKIDHRTEMFGIWSITNSVLITALVAIV